MSRQIPPSHENLPLSDVRVLDASLLLPGPFCGQILADLGADVIHLEPPQGDFTRGTSTRMHEVANRNKRSLVLNLREEAHREAFGAVAAGVDVVLEGFRPGVAERLGIDYERVRARNPGVVYCSISGFGQDGPLRTAPGHDVIYLAAAGALEYSGHWHEDPRRMGLPVSDLATSAYAAVAILAALHRRGAGGPGCYIDLAITDVAMALTTVRAGPDFDAHGQDRRHLYPANELFTAADGVVLAVAAVEPHFWDGLRAVIGEREPAIHDARFDDDQGRHRHGDELFALLARVVAQEPAAVWLRELAARDVPVQPVLSPPEAAAAALARGRDVVVDRDGQRHVPFPALADGRPMASVRSTAPELGADTEAILREAGLDDAELARILG
jgi:crotonobetainyl-CoA:carnitine CoA-transferase CaiB-like acyl-CoA transferase